MNVNSLGGDDSANNLSKIEFKNQSIDSSIRSLSRGEEFLQKDILQVLNCQPAVSIININQFYPQKNNGNGSFIKNNNNESHHIPELSIENSFQSKGSKNFVLKCDFLNNTNNSKKNSFNFDQNINGFNQKNFFKHSTDQEDEIEANNRNKNSLQNISDKEIDIHMFHNNNIFNETNENSRINKSKNNQSNNLQELHQTMEDNIDSINNHFTNMNISNNEINVHNTFEDNNFNLNYFNGNNMNLNDYLNISQNNQINNQKNKNYTNIDPTLINQNNNMNPIMIANSFNNNEQNLYNLDQNNLNNHKRKEEILIESCETLCKEQLECRQLQKMIDDNPSIASDLLYGKIKDKIQEISFDQFGNYFIQKVIEQLNEEQIRELLCKNITKFQIFLFQSAWHQGNSKNF